MPNWKMYIECNKCKSLRDVKGEVRLVAKASGNGSWSECDCKVVYEPTEPQGTCLSRECGSREYDLVFMKEEE